MKQFERRLIVLTKYSTLAAVVGSLAGAFLMFFLGLVNIWEAYGVWLPISHDSATAVSRGAQAVISVIEGLDRFLIGIVLLYFGYGVYSLFIRTEIPEQFLGLPAMLRVSQIGQLKQVVAEVIIVILFVLFLRTAMQVFQRTSGAMSWDQAAMLLVLPACTALLALALKLVQLHPKPERPKAAGSNEGEPHQDSVEEPRSEKSAVFDEGV